MSLLRLLQLLTVSLVILSAAMLGLGQEEPWFTYTIAAAALAAFLLNDCLGWFYVHRFIANGAMLVTAVLILNDFFSLSSREQLLAIGELLVYVQIILLSQKKNERVYGQVAIFSLLAVVVAALLTHSLAFGLMVLAYTVVGTYAISLFSLYRGNQGIGLHAPRWRRRNPLLSQIEFQPVEPPPAVSRGLVRYGVLREIAAIAAATVLFGAAFFYTLPRVGGIGWQEGGFAASQRVGFSPEITFDEMGKLLKSNRLVMRVTFRHARTDAPYTIITTPYFRGGVLTRYVLDKGRPRWKADVAQGFRGSMRLSRAKPTAELVAVDILLEPTRDSRLFFIYPPYSTQQTPEDLRFNTGLRTLFRKQDEGEQQSSNSRSYRYETATTAFRFGLQTPVTPHVNPLETARQRFRLLAEHHRLLKMQPEDYDRLGTFEEPEDRFPGLRRLAKRIVAERAPNGNHYEQAIALQNWFLEDGRFTYTLDLTEIRSRRRPELDPVEDFVVNHRHGHCQYFSSALALMLRAVGIPSRIVIGYKGGEFNHFGQYYLVRQRDAHAWVEAYVRPEEIPINAIQEVERHAGGGWLRLDPTPAREDAAGADRNILDRVNDSLDYAQWLWSDYVLNLNPDQQRAAGLGRLDTSSQWDWTQLLSPRQWRPDQRKRTSGGTGGKSGWQWWKLAMIAAAGVVTALLVRIRWPGRRRRQRAARAPLPSIVYYRKLELLLRRFGCQRPPGTTPREFARSSAWRIAETLNDPATSALPEQIVEAYYQDRFRPEGAPAPLVEAASQALGQLEAAYHQWRQQRKRRT